MPETPHPNSCVPSLRVLRGVVQGAQISAPFGKYSAAVDVLEVLGGKNAAGA